MIVYSNIILVLILGGLILTALCAFIWKKLKFNAFAGGFIGFILGLAGLILTMYFSRNVYIVTGEKEYQHYAVFKGDRLYTLKNGKKIKLIKSDRALLINNTPNELSVTEVIYGSFAFAKKTLVKGFSSESFSEGSIDYFFDDEPPKEISSNGQEKVVRFWVKHKQ